VSLLPEIPPVGKPPIGMTVIVIHCECGAAHEGSRLTRYADLQPPYPFKPLTIISIPSASGCPWYSPGRFSEIIVIPIPR